MCIPFVCCSVLLLLLSQTGTGAHVIGEWDYRVPPVQLADGGEVHEEWQFRRDGSFVQMLRMEAHGTYKIAGNHLISTLVKWFPDPTEFSIEGNVLIIKVDGEEVRLERLSSFSPSTDAVVGRWGVKVPFFDQVGVFEIALTGDGGITLKFQGQAMKGRYRIKNSLLTTIDRTGTTKYQFRLERGLLFLKPLDEANSEEKKYRRIRR